MTSRERIGTAQHTSNLGEVGLEDIGDVDIIRASGMSGQANPLGMSIWRWRYGGDVRAMFTVAKGLVEMGHAPELVGTVLSHLSNDVCPHCSGRGYELLPGAPVLSDDMCMHCHGTGRKPLVGMEENALADTISRMEREIASAIMRKLSRQMEF